MEWWQGAIMGAVIGLMCCAILEIEKYLKKYLKARKGKKEVKQ